MKKLTYLIAVASASMLCFVSCDKDIFDKDDEETVISLTFNATVEFNGTYTFTLPENKSDDPFQITSQAAHFSSSQLVRTGNGDEMIYQYTPARDFSGSDQIVISTVEEKHDGDHKGSVRRDGGGGCGDHHGNGHRRKHHEEEVEQIITINIAIIPQADSQVVSHIPLSISRQNIRTK